MNEKQNQKLKNVHWFPGHMVKATREIIERLNTLDPEIKKSNDTIKKLENEIDKNKKESEAVLDAQAKP